MIAPFDALVLAGGAGQRMGDPRGTDKAGLDVGGVTLLDRVLAAVVDAQRCVVVGPRRPTARVVTFTIEEPAGSGPAAAIVHGLSMVHAPIVVVVYEKIVAGRIAQGVPAFLVTLALALPLTIAFARVFASVFEIPFLKQHTWSESARMPQPRVDGGPG